MSGIRPSEGERLPHNTVVAAVDRGGDLGLGEVADLGDWVRYREEVGGRQDKVTLVGHTAFEVGFSRSLVWVGLSGEGCRHGNRTSHQDVRGHRMNTRDIHYVLEPSSFRTMGEAQDLTDTLEDALARRSLGAPNTGAELVEIFSELVNNAAEHGVSATAAQAHARFMPHRRGHAFDVVIVDSGAGIRDTLARNPELDVPENDAESIRLATRELVSGTGNPVRGIGLWMTVTEMGKPGRKLWLHSGSGLLTMYGANDPEFREIKHRQGVLVRLTLPC